MGTAGEQAVARPSRIGRFEVVGVLGEGGMGVVYDALDPTLGRHVAIKLLHNEQVGADAGARLLREAQALARLAHPNVVTIFEAGRDGEQVFLAMERVSGSNARAWREAAPRTPAEVLDVYLQAAAGLAAAHAAGLVHRDVKPENILVGADGRVRITDFGLVAAADAATDAPHEAIPDDADPLSASLTRTGMLLGTPAYMAPEVHDKRSADALADQWSLCVSIWEALAGVRPFGGGTYRELARCVLAGTITRGSEAIAPDVRAVLERGLRVERDRRWPTVAALAAALTSPPVDATASSVEAGPSVPTAKTVPGPRRVVPVALAVAALGGTGAAYVLWPRELAPPPATPMVVTPPAAIAPVRITEPGGCPYMPIWTDEDTLVYDDGAGAVWRHDIGGRPEILVDLPNSDDWRPNRGRTPNEVVFASGLNEKGGHSAAVDLATKVVTPLPISSPSLAPVNGAIYFTRMDIPEIRRLRGTEDGLVTRLPNGYWPYTISLSRDGTQLAVNTNGDRGPVTMCMGAVDTKTDRVVGELECLPRTDVDRGRAAYSADGRDLYYPTTAGIRRRRVEAGRVDDILWRPGLDGMSGIDISPAGTQMVFSNARPGEEILDVVANKPVLVGRKNATPGRDGAWFHLRPIDGGHELVMQRADGSQLVLTPPGLGKMQWLSPEPTGERIAFELDGDKPGIYVTTTNGLPPIRVSDSIADIHPVWLRDGRLAYTHITEGKAPEMVIVDPDNGLEGIEHRKPAHPAARQTQSVLPDGRLALSNMDGGVLYVWDPVTRREQKLELPPHQSVIQATSSPDGTSIIVMGSRGLWRIPVPQGPKDTRKPEPVREQRACETFGKPFFVDGKLVVQSGRWRGDVYTLPVVD